MRSALPIRAALLPAVVLLAGCGGTATPGVQPGPSAADPDCAQLLGRLPAALAGHRRTAPPAKGAAAWGPAVLRCGVAPLAPTPDSCIGIDGVDWVFTETADAYRFTTYGRTPAVEVTLPSSLDRTRAPGEITGLTAAVRPLPQNRRCD